jgi:hypothetical protein
VAVGVASKPRFSYGLGRFVAVVAAALTTVSARPTTARADVSTTSIEQGFEQGRIQTPRSTAFGGAQTALGTSTTALYENPANLPLSRVYHFEGLAGLGPEARRQSYGAGVVDSSTSRVAGGIGGTWNVLDPDGIHRQWTDLRLALAYPFGDRFSLGATGRYLRADQRIGSGPLAQSNTPDAASDGSPNGPIFNAFTFDVGATFVLTEGLRIAAVGHNLTNPGTGLAPTWVSGGIGYGHDLFSVEFDAAADFTTFKSTRARYMAGGEVFLANRVPLRVGYRYDDGLKTHAISGGLGYVDKSWSVELGGMHEIAGEHPATFLTLGLRLFYNATGGGDLDTTNEAF